MKCDYCKKDIHDGQTIIPITIDGDMVCSLECKSLWEKERDRFFGEVIHDDEKMADWWNE